MHYRFLAPGATRRLALVALTWLCLAPTAHSADTLISKGPYIQMPAPGTVSILWEAETNYPAQVRFGAGKVLDRFLEPTITEMKSLANTASATKAKPAPTRKFYVYSARIQGLPPGQEYSYSVEVAGIRTATRRFRTLQPGAPVTRFIAYGDSRSDPVKHRALADQFLPHQPEFILHTGDLVARGEDYELWSREFFDPTAKVIDHVPLFPVIGNHEQNGTNFLGYFELPGNELWYSFDAGPVHFLALDFRSEKRDCLQYRFAKEDLGKSKAPWKIVYLHAPLFNLGGHSSRWGHTDYLPLFHDAGVDMVLAGHSHIYERFKALASGRSVITHITTGGGGANLHDTVQHPAVVYTDSTNHFIVFEATRDELHGRALRVDGVELDHFALRKTDGRYGKDFLSDSYREKDLNWFFESYPLLLPKMAGLPTPEKPVAAMLTVPGQKGASRKMRLDVTLSPSSASAYELLSEPVRFQTPKAGVTNTVWTWVRAKAGVKVSTNSSGELLPRLAFQARVSGGNGETFATGKPAKLSETARKTAPSFPAP